MKYVFRIISTFTFLYFLSSCSHVFNEKIIGECNSVKRSAIFKLIPENDIEYKPMNRRNLKDSFLIMNRIKEDVGGFDINVNIDGKKYKINRDLNFLGMTYTKEGRVFHYVVDSGSFVQVSFFALIRDNGLCTYTQLSN